VTAVIRDVARRGEESQVGPILDGLAAFEAHEEIVGLLDQLPTLLKDNLRNRAILLLERKQQGLEFERVAALFRETRSPYQMLKPLGQGLFTAAYLARDESNELDVVIRVLRPEFACWPRIRAQFLDLARRSVKLIHHNLVLTRDVRDFGDRRIYYAVRDYVEGVTLQRLLETGRRFAPGQIIRILQQVALAMIPIHAGGMVHGSIKPSNIFLCGEDRVVLGDLAIPAGGISLQLDRLSYDYRYAPPEIFRRGGQLGPWSDFYSLGCLAYELACGSPPFASDNHFELAGLHDRAVAEPPSRCGSGLGPPGDALILGLLAKTPGERPASPNVVLRALEDLGRAPDLADQFDAAGPSRDMARRPTAEEAAPTGPILGESSLIRYTTDDMVSIISFAARPEALGFDQDLQATTALAATSAEDSRILSADTLPSVIGRYKILQLIGRGGLGSVLLARDEALNRVVALKLSLGGSRISPEVRARFQREALAVARLAHPNIVTLYDVGQTDEFAYTVLEFVEGGDLRARMGKGPWPVEAAARLVLTLARAMEYAHSLGIVHRDLKPSNILLTRKDEPKISDFGLAKLVGEQEESATVTFEGTVVGTPYYMAPEQAAGEIDKIGQAVDIYALGTILYELLAGRRPFQGGTVLETLMQVRERRPDPPTRWQPGVPRDLDAICLRCLEKSPRDRYATAGGLAHDLERFLEGRPLFAGRPTFWVRARRFLPFKWPGAGKARPAR
jgi:serine/threonine protein kinase